LYQESEVSRNDPYSETTLPNETVMFQRKIRENPARVKSMTLILDSNIFLNVIKEIQYFYQRKLLTNEELLLLKEDMLHLIEQYEKTAQTGCFGTVNAQLYLSSLCVNSNAVYYSCDDKPEPLFWIFTNNPVIIQNAKFSAMHIKWLNALRRQSSLITQSNEIMQAEFFFLQRNYVEKYLSAEIPE